MKSRKIEKLPEIYVNDDGTRNYSFKTDLKCIRLLWEKQCEIIDELNKREEGK